MSLKSKKYEYFCEMLGFYDMVNQFYNIDIEKIGIRMSTAFTSLLPLFAGVTRVVRGGKVKYETS